jgi:hypothetical protein
LERTRDSTIHATDQSSSWRSFLATLREILYWIAVGENAVAQQVVDAAFRVHTSLGPGLLESVYEAALAYELEKRGLSIARQQGIPVVYEGVRIHAGFFADLVVEVPMSPRTASRGWFSGKVRYKSRPRPMAR